MQDLRDEVGRSMNCLLTKSAKLTDIMTKLEKMKSEQAARPLYETHALQDVCTDALAYCTPFALKFGEILERPPEQDGPELRHACKNPCQTEEPRSSQEVPWLVDSMSVSPLCAHASVW